MGCSEHLCHSTALLLTLVSMPYGTFYSSEVLCWKCVLVWILKHMQGIRIYLFFLNKKILTEVGLLLGSHLIPHITATISKWYGLFGSFAFQLPTSRTCVFASPPCSSLIISWVRFSNFHWKPFTLVAFLFRWLRAKEFSISPCTLFRCSLCWEPIVALPSPKQSFKSY